VAYNPHITGSLILKIRIIWAPKALGVPQSPKAPANTDNFRSEPVWWAGFSSEQKMIEKEN